jgi:hypothetical protein
MAIGITEKYLPRTVRATLPGTKIRADLLKMLLPRIQFIHLKREMIAAVA